MNVTETLRNWCQVCDDDLTDECILADHGPVLVDADFVWVICSRCRGEGVLGGWPGAYTESDRAEWSEEDYEDYMTTQRRCEDCDGTGKLLELTDAAMSRPIVERWFIEEYEYRREVEAERRMGA